LDPLASGRMLLHYRLLGKIGEGGMGEVWKALDTTLDREVAIKVLPEALASDIERLHRFEREARLLATFSHPNIATVHGLHEAGGVRFLVMELAGGEDLARRLARGPLPATEALAIALQVAEALEAAHERGIIHRDLKPANIQIAPDGGVKVLDFGLAKAFERDARDPADATRSPTLTSAGTRAGVILGTAAYMSPEQAKGRAVDRRADIWAFGCVLLEMLTGRQTFAGDSVAETLASVIKETPDWQALPANTPPSVRRLLRRCLVKEARQRLRDIGEARILISETLAGESDETSDAGPPVVATGPPWKRRAPWAIAVLLAVALAWSWGLRRPVADGGARAQGSPRLSMILPQDGPLFLPNLDLEMMPCFAISSSGDRVVYTAREDKERSLKGGGRRALRLRELGGYQAERLRGTESSELPFFSPDGRWIGFFDGGSLVKVPASGGAPVVIAENVGNGTGASWGPDGTIVFAHSYVGPLWIVPESAGEPRPLTTLAEGERSHRFPQFLPDGRSVLFTIKPSGIVSFDDAKIAIADTRSGNHRVLAQGGTYARYLSSGHLVYARQGGLLAAPFDLDGLTVTGGAVPVLDGVIVNRVTGAALFDVSRNGTLAWVPGDYSSGPTRLVRLDRETGKRERLAEGQYVAAPHLSPDGLRLALHGPAANDQVVVLDLARGTVARVTDASTNNILPIWGPDGERIVFTTDRSGREEIVSMPADGGEIDTLVPPRDVPQDAYSWSPDGRLLAINVGVRSSRDIWVLDTTSGGDAVPFLQTPFDEGDPVFSPDGRWVAYSSDESGVLEVYARPYPGPGGKIQLSTGGGFFPRWRADGTELYYQTETALFAVPVRWDTGLRPARPRVLFEIEAAVPLGFDVSRDGRTFYVVELDESSWQSDRIDIVLNWTDELRRLDAVR